MKHPKDRLPKVFVIGVTPAGIAAVNKLGELGIPVTLVDEEPDIDQKLSHDKWRLKSGILLNHAHRPGLLRILRNPAINCILPAKINSVKHNLQGFRVSLTPLQTFIDPDKCTLCGKCVTVCPVETEDHQKAIKFTSRLSLPGRVIIDKRRLPFCRQDCPLGVNVQGYLALTKKKKFKEALELIREKNILPGICGRICTHPCEAQCRRQEIDDAIAIKDIKRFLADYETEIQPNIQPKISPNAPAIAIIGSGPAGLAAAAELIRFGGRVIIFEKEEKAGGLLRYGIGPHRLPRNILDNELDYLTRMGVEILTSQKIDLAKGFDDFKQKFAAVILATGTWQDRKLGVKGEDLTNIEGCLSSLYQFNKNNLQSSDEKVAVIGDGNAAFDLARCLVRLGRQVTIISWFGKDEIPADKEEVIAALEEGIIIKNNCQVVGFSGANSIFKKLLCKPTQPGRLDQNQADPNNIIWPEIIPQSETFELEFDRAFVAIGLMGALQQKKAASGLEINTAGYIKTENKYYTGLPGIYAVGDAVTGPSAVILAMAHGKSAASQVAYDIGLCKSPPQAESNRPDWKDFNPIGQNLPKLKKAQMPEKQPVFRKNNFNEVALGLTEDQVIYEAQRCLQCGICSECMLCVKECEAIKAVRHEEIEEKRVEYAGVIIIADPAQAPAVKGEDIIRAYGPKSSKTDTAAMFTRGFAAAGQAMALLGNTSQSPKGRISYSQPDPGLADQIRIGVFVCQCNLSLGWLPEMDEYVDHLASDAAVIHAEILPAACTPDGSASIVDTVRGKGITRIVLASCVCCPLNYVCSACTDQRSRLKEALFTATGISRSMVETCNIRGEALSLIEKSPFIALQHFQGLLERSLKRVHRLKPFAVPVRTYNFRTAVIGSSEAAITSAVTLAKSGRDVALLGTASRPLTIDPEHSNIQCFSGSTVKHFSGTLGDFEITVQNTELNNDQQQRIQVGAVILGEKARKTIKYIRQPELPGREVSAVTQKKGVTGIPYFYPGMTQISGLFLANPKEISVSFRKKGAAAAVLAAAVMPRGPRLSKGYTVAVDKNKCRGCGRCIQVCPYFAITLQTDSNQGWFAVVDDAFCKGCGNCISVCPSNAADSPYRSQVHLERILEEILQQ